jgi:hypothetical protein
MRDVLTRLLLGVRSILLNAENRFDDRYLDVNVPFSKLVNHSRWKEHLAELANKAGSKVLEIGSREVTGPSSAREDFCNAEYVGFDYYPGENVDVVGDAHKLSTYFPEGERFDLIFSSATFEHFAMPWVVAQEMIKLLKVGGFVFVETHFSHGSHDRPWHFFQFSDLALRVLFSPLAGIECVEAGASNPLVGRFSSLADPYLRNTHVPGLYCHSEFLGRKVQDVPALDWTAVEVSRLLGGTHYPVLSDLQAV